MSAIHGQSHKAVKHFREKPAALAVYWIYLSRANPEGVAWPTARGLERDTDWSINTCREARTWLVEHKALELVKDYIRPQWRSLKGKEKSRTLNLDKSEYYRITGHLEVNGNLIPMMYFGSQEVSDIDDLDVSPDDTSNTDAKSTDVSPPDTSTREEVTDESPGATSNGMHHASGDTELNTIKESKGNTTEEKEKDSSAPAEQLLGFVGQDEKPSDPIADFFAGLDFLDKPHAEATPQEKLDIAVSDFFTAKYPPPDKGWSHLHMLVNFFTGKMQSTSKQKSFLENQFVEDPFDAEEIVGMILWWQDENEELLSLTKPATIAEKAGLFRISEHYDKYLHDGGERLQMLIDEIKAEPEPEAEKEYVSDEEAAAFIADLHADFAEVGS